MDIILDSISTIVFCGVIFGLVWIQRKLFEILMGRFKPSLLSGQTVISKLYTELFLPAAPLGVGGIAAFMYPSYPFPEIFTSSIEGIVFYGVFCGLISGQVYRTVKKMLAAKLKSLGGNSVPPGAIG